MEITKSDISEVTSEEEDTEAPQLSKRVPFLNMQKCPNGHRVACNFGLNRPVKVEKGFSWPLA